MFGGFVSKVYLAYAGAALGGLRRIGVLAALAVSTGLNVAYLLRAVLNLYRPKEEEKGPATRIRTDAPFAFSMILLITLNLGLGIFGDTIMKWINSGFQMFIG